MQPVWRQTLEHSALLDLHQGRFDQAQSILNESLAIRRALLGPNWEGLLWTRHWQALSHFAEGRFEQAGELLDITISDYQRSFAASSHLLAFARSDRGWVALATGDIASARQWFSAAIEGLEAVQSGDHPRLAEPLMGRALVELRSGSDHAGPPVGKTRTRDPPAPLRKHPGSTHLVDDRLPGAAPGQWIVSVARDTVRSDNWS